MLDVVILIVAEQLNVSSQSLDRESSFATVPNWDSLATMRIALAIEEEFDLTFSTKELLSIKSIAGIMDLLVAKASVKE